MQSTVKEDSLKTAMIIFGLTLTVTAASFASFPGTRLRTVYQACTTPDGRPAFQTICLDGGYDFCAFQACGVWGN